MDVSDLFAIQARLLGALPASRRFLYGRVRWENRLTCLYGGRGVGKTTLMLQRLREEGEAGGKGLYFSADHVQVAARGIYAIAADFFRHGGESVFVDEAHKRPGWAQEIKSLYDAFPGVRLVVSGSSSLALHDGKADLSRRAVYLRLPVLSFREYLDLAAGRRVAATTLEGILAGHQGLAAEVLAGGPVLGHFRDYLERGAYPFVLEGEADYLQRLGNVLEKALYEDLAVSEGRRAGGITAMKKLLWLVATSPPMRLDIAGVSRDLGVARPTVYAYLDALERAGLLLSVPPAGEGAKLVRKDSKLFLENTNLLWGISQSLTRADPTGSLRETFFANQLTSAGLRVRAAARGDFRVEDRHTFELGGRSKGRAQVAGLEDAWVIQDDREVGQGRMLPLWLFGLLY